MFYASDHWELMKHVELKHKPSQSEFHLDEAAPISLLINYVSCHYMSGCGIKLFNWDEIPIKLFL
jgi:hypothetical protein